VVHINAAVAGLVGAYLIGKRVGYGKEAMAPHSLTLTMVGASLLWVGWFGFNAGSNLEANGMRCPGLHQHLLATAAAALAWMLANALLQGQGLDAGCGLGRGGRPGGDHPGLRLRRRPMGALVIGLVAGVVCLWGVNGLKRLLGADDSLDVFGVHGVGGIVGALLTGVFAAPPGRHRHLQLRHQQVRRVGQHRRPGVDPGPGRVLDHRLVGGGGLHRLQDRRPDHRPARARREEREGLDITSHGETAYSK
jgi:Amt family ammonium transporter